jgi:uncharacterized protein with FMN-binding domain
MGNENNYYLVPGSELNDIGDAIREKVDPDKEYAVEEMADAIREISTGAELPDLTNPAASGDILSGKEAIDENGNILTGTMATQTLPTPVISKSTSNQISASVTLASNGYVQSGTRTANISPVSLDSNLISENIRTGATIFGVQGSCPSVQALLTWSVSDVSGAANGFVLNSDGYWESNNKGKKSSYALCRITLNVIKAGDITLDVINFAESTYDYAIFSTLDSTYSTNMTDETAKTAHTFKGKQSASVVNISYPNVSVGNHTIDVKFIKDSSQDKNNDSVQFKVQNADSNCNHTFKHLNVTSMGEYNATADGVSGYNSVSVQDSDLKAENIKNGVNILGVAGTYKPVLEDKTFTSNGTFESTGSDGFGKVTVNVDTTCEHTFGTKHITSNGTYNASIDGHSGFTSVEVNVPIPDNYIDTSDANATADTMTEGVTAYVKGEKIEGTIPHRASDDITVEGNFVLVPKGFYEEQSGVTIPKGEVTSFVDTQGPGPSDYSKYYLQVYADVSTPGYVSGHCGSTTLLLNRYNPSGYAYDDNVHITPTTSSQTIITGDVYNPVVVDRRITVAGDADLKAENIKDGVNIFGVTGTYQGPTKVGPYFDLSALRNEGEILSHWDGYANGQSDIFFIWAGPYGGGGFGWNCLRDLEVDGGNAPVEETITYIGKAKLTGELYERVLYLVHLSITDVDLYESDSWIVDGVTTEYSHEP